MCFLLLYSCWHTFSFSACVFSMCLLSLCLLCCLFHFYILTNAYFVSSCWWYVCCCIFCFNILTNAYFLTFLVVFVVLHFLFLLLWFWFCCIFPVLCCWCMFRIFCSLLVCLCCVSPPVPGVFVLCLCCHPFKAFLAAVILLASSFVSWPGVGRKVSPYVPSNVRCSISLVCVDSSHPVRALSCIFWNTASVPVALCNLTLCLLSLYL